LSRGIAAHVARRASRVGSDGGNRAGRFRRARRARDRVERVIEERERALIVRARVGSLALDLGRWKWEGSMGADARGEAMGRGRGMWIIAG
jgi:hypothetical protein